jgi:hypothetical protein
MQFDAYYVVAGRPALRTHPALDPELAALLCEPRVIRNSEGGRTVWGGENYLTLMKLLHLATVRKEYGADRFEWLPLTAASFDAWWTIERYDDVVAARDLWSDLDRSSFAAAPPTGDPLVDDFLRQFAEDILPGKPLRSEAFQRFRIWLGSEVIGWFEDAVWTGSGFEGRWQPTNNREGKAFAAAQVDGSPHAVELEGPHFLRATLTLRGDRGTVDVRVD